MTTMRVFLSHHPDDNAIYNRLTATLQAADVDIWPDSSIQRTDQPSEDIAIELKDRPIFIVLLSLAALHAQRVHDEAKQAYEFYQKNPARHIILPVVVAPLEETDLWDFLRDFNRIEDSGHQPLPPEETIRRVMHALVLVPNDETTQTLHSGSSESVADLICQGKALRIQTRHQEALALFQRATELVPDADEAWLEHGNTLLDLERV